MRMPRFLKGTTDHDQDGRPGGSNPKGLTMRKATTKKAKMEATKEANAELDAVATAMAIAPNPQSGSVGIMDEDQKPSRTEVKKAQAAALEARFAEADGKGQPKSAEIEENRIRLAARGF